MMTGLLNRRKFAARLPFNSVGIGTYFHDAVADGSTSGKDSGARKLDYDGKPAGGTQMITPPIVHQGLIHISGQGAHDAGSAEQNDIESHTTKVMNNVKKTVQAGGNMNGILQLTVYLANLDYYEGMNRVFKTYFPHGGPPRTTVSVAGVPGRSLREINCIAAITRK